MGDMRGINSIRTIVVRNMTETFHRNSRARFMQGACGLGLAVRHDNRGSSGEKSLVHSLQAVSVEVVLGDGGLSTKLSATEFHAVETGPGGTVFAVLEHHRDGKFTTPVIAKFDPVTFAWHEQGSIPSPFSPMNASTYIRSFQAGNRVLLLNASYNHDVPRWLYPWKEASVSANANYYSVDEGRAWSKLDVPGYLGLAGFDSSRDTIYRIGENARFGDREIESLRLE